jgi:hypothetical protein
MTEETKIGEIDWSHLKHWQVFDPVPWWILDKEKLQRIMVVQLDAKIQAKKAEIEQMEKIREIVRK